jgi:hypothetical protein
VRLPAPRPTLIAALAASLLLALAAQFAPHAGGAARAQASAAGPTDEERYLLALRIFEEEAAAYWGTVEARRRARADKRRNRQPVASGDYVLAQPPVYAGPPRPPGPAVPAPPRREIPVVADFLRHAQEQFGFVPRRAPDELAFKRAYARAAMDAGLTMEQVVGIYAFETGGNGAYDTQAGFPGPGRPAISPALGYNQLLSTNSIGLVAEHGDRLVKLLTERAGRLAGAEREAMQQKIAALRRMIAFSRSVPFGWSAHDKLAKTTPGGMGIHAVLLDLDLGPWLQTRKLATSVAYARRQGHQRPLTPAELQLMNFTGDGNGIDMVTMPQELRARVPTANFFQRAGYERNPIARRTAVVAGLIASIAERMERSARAPGAQDLAAAFIDLSPVSGTR